MKLRQFVIGMVPLLSLAVMSQAQTVTTVDWKFSAAGNPSAPTSVTSTSPLSVVAQASFLSGSKVYSFFPISEELYGPPSGLWSMGRIGTNEPLLELTLVDLTPVTTVDLTVAITHFVGSSPAIFPGTISFDLPNVELVGRTTVLQQSGAMVGSWVQDTYRWIGVEYPGAPITLEITPGAGSGALLLDEVLFTVTGNLTAVPEPMPFQIAGAGLVILGVGSWFRRARRSSS